MDQSVRILFCHCANAQVLSADAKAHVLAGLRQTGIPTSEVADLCAMSARKDPALKEWANQPNTVVVACYPRAVRALFGGAGAALTENAQMLNLRADSAEKVLSEACAMAGVEVPTVTNPSPAIPPADTAETGENRAAPAWLAWFPVIDYERCTHCMQCLSFCLFGVFGTDDQRKLEVQHPDQCKTNCPACSRVCPEAAIVFPKYKAGPINGDKVSDADVKREALKVDISALLGGDVYQALRERSERSKNRFSKERDADKALLERRQCLQKLVQSVDIPPEVLMALPSPEEIQRRAAEAQARAQAAKEGRS